MYLHSSAFQRRRDPGRTGEPAFFVRIKIDQSSVVAILRGRETWPVAVKSYRIGSSDGPSTSRRPGGSGVFGPHRLLNPGYGLEANWRPPNASRKKTGRSITGGLIPA
jgi:hypothetical protein